MYEVGWYSVPSYHFGNAKLVYSPKESMTSPPTGNHYSYNGKGPGPLAEEATQFQERSKLLDDYVIRAMVDLDDP